MGATGGFSPTLSAAGPSISYGLVRTQNCICKQTMRLSRSADYALRAVIYLAGLSDGELASGAVIANATGVGESFLLKVLRLLVKSRLVKAQPGAGGGFKLRLPAVQMTMLQVIEAVDGPLESGTCIADDQPCDRKAWCGVRVILDDMHRHAVRLLSQTSIDRLRRDGANSNCPLS